MRLADPAVSWGLWSLSSAKPEHFLRKTFLWGDTPLLHPSTKIQHHLLACQQRAVRWWMGVLWLGCRNAFETKDGGLPVCHIGSNRLRWTLESMSSTSLMSMMYPWHCSTLLVRDSQTWLMITIIYLGSTLKKKKKQNCSPRSSILRFRQNLGNLYI